MKPETIGKILAPAAAIIAPVLADKLAEIIEPKVDEFLDKFGEKLLDKLPDLSHLDDEVIDLIKRGFNALPFPIKL
ncbi:hypothetical protein FGG44_gp97 [Mycobacterium phage MacnCheese]|uniref:Uncharacterized protein n=1 Tax=Mycobacterium phage MacnCheese TaxID=2927982 RepID=I6W800_9CAUD|nr:hypothetical protein FGG44_gp97 [Mycobacterium phage MacnCheese]AFN37785.1 hypothetical protein MACNCHEESE_97 [Mycobacterium phage MacnCheese]